MGCNCTKGMRANDSLDNINNYVKERRRSKPNHKTSKKKKKSVSSSIQNNLKSEERGVNSINHEATLRFLIPIDAKNHFISSDEADKKVNLERKSSKSLFQRRPTVEVGATLQQPKMTRINCVSNGERGAQGNGEKIERMIYSGPLVSAGGNLDEMLKEHERQIQLAVRKARVDKKTNRDDKGQTKAFLAANGR